MSENRITIKWDKASSTAVSCILIFEDLPEDSGTVVFGHIRGAAEHGWMADYSRGRQTFHTTLEEAATKMQGEIAEVILQGLAGSLESPPYLDRQTREIDEFLGSIDPSATVQH